MSPAVRLTLHRGRTGDQGTAGVLTRPDGSRLAFTMELPWKDNARQVSCIPPGEYLCRMRRSPHFGAVYEIARVPGRTNVLIHTGNFGGDRAKGYRSDVLGCVVLGLNRGILKGQQAVFVSRPAVTRLEQEMGGQPFTLEIHAWESSTSSPAASAASSEPPAQSPERSST